ncbi:MAG TPA: phage portal protein [Candidatus Competibacter phosphatis]|nr:phage portal protein [Candidatus Competibacter phosphatis]
MQSNTYAGPAVTEESALTFSAVYACVRILSESVAMLPLFTYRRLANGGKEKATDTAIYNLLHRTPNPEMTSFEFRETLIAHVATWGNGYAEIEWSNSGQPLALWPLNPARMQVSRRAGNLVYLYELPNGQAVTLPAYRVHHLRGLSGNGVVGYSPIRLAMQSIGVGLALEEYGARFFGNGARPGGVLKHPGVLSDGAYKRLKDSWAAESEGLSNAHRLKILEEGLDYQSIGIPPEEAQFLESKKFQVNEIARWFRIPPHMLADLERATFSNIEEQGLEFVIYTLGPWLTRHEQAIERDLLTEAERQTLFVEYLVNGLLRGNISSRFQAYQLALQGGWMNPNEVRTLENMNPYEGGDTYLMPLNMAPAGTTTTDSDGNGLDAQGAERSAHLPACTCATCRGVSRETETVTPKPKKPLHGKTHDNHGQDPDEKRAQALGNQRRKVMESYVGLYADVAGRMVRREVNDVRRALESFTRKRTIQDFVLWLETFYGDYRSVLAEAFLPTMLSLAQQMTGVVASELDLDDDGVTDALRSFVDEYLEQFAALTAIGSQRQLEAIISEALNEGADPVPLLEERLDGWTATKAQKIAGQQAFEAGNALITSLYVAAGVTLLRWVANSGACPYCQKLDRKIIGIQDYFIQGGASVDGADGDEPMLVRRNTRHPPLHRDCTCVIVAEREG